MPDRERHTLCIVTLELSRAAGRIVVVTTAAPSYKRHRYPSEIIDHCVWLYFRFTLSSLDMEE